MVAILSLLASSSTLCVVAIILSADSAVCSANSAYKEITSNVTFSHPRSKELTGIHKPCIPGLFPIPRVHLKVNQRVQSNNFPGIHLNVHRCTSGESNSYDLSFDLKLQLFVEGSVYLVKHKTFDCGI